jgi:hypothetical protein
MFHTQPEIGEHNRISLSPYDAPWSTITNLNEKVVDHCKVLEIETSVDVTLDQ